MYRAYENILQQFEMRVQQRISNEISFLSVCIIPNQCNNPEKIIYIQYMNQRFRLDTFTYENNKNATTQKGPNGINERKTNKTKPK